MMRTRMLPLLVLLLLCVMAGAQSPSLVLQKGHVKRVNSLRFSKDAKWMVTTSDDGMIKIWDTFSQKLVSELGGNGVQYLDANFSSDNKSIIASSAPQSDGWANIRDIYHNPQRYMLYHKTPFYIWDIASGQLVYALTNTNETHSMSPGNVWIATHPDKIKTKNDLTRAVTITDAPISISNAATGKLLRQVTTCIDSTTDAATLVAFLSDSILLTGYENKTALHNRDIFITKYSVFNFFTGVETSVFNDTSNIDKGGSWLLGPGRNYFFRYNSQGRHQIDGYSNGKQPFAELWNIAQHKLIWSKPVELQDYTFANGDSVIWTMQQVPIDSTRLDADMLKAVRLTIHDTVDVFEMPGEYYSDAISVSSKKQHFYATAVMDVNTVPLPSPHSDSTYNIAIWKDATKISSSDCKSLVSAISFSPNDQFLVTGHEDGNITLWDFKDTTASQIAGTSNIIDPLVQLYAGKASSKIWWLTKTMYGVQDANTVNKLSFIDNREVPVKDINYLLKEKYSLMNLIPDYGSAGSLYIIDNSKSTVVKKISVRAGTGFPHISVEGNNKIELPAKDRWRIQLNYPGLRSFTVYSNLSKLVNAGPGINAQEIRMIYGILEGDTGSDTTLLSTNYSFTGMPYNIALKSYILKIFKPYYLPRAMPAAVLQPAAPGPGNKFLDAPMVSNDGRYLLGRDSAGKNSDRQYLYAQDLKANTVFKTPVSFQQERLAVLNRFDISPNKKLACILTDAVLSLGINFVRVIDAQTGQPLYNLEAYSGTITGIAYTADSKYLYTWTEGGTCTKWNLGNGKEVYRMVFFQDHDYAIILPDGYYFISSRTDAKYLNFKINNRLYNFSQFDLQYNRPDKVLAAIGSNDKALVNEYYKAWQDRIRKAGFNEKEVNSNIIHVPSVIIDAGNMQAFTNQRELPLSFTVSDSLFNIKTYNIFINDVPLNGINGKALLQPLRTTALAQTVSLSEGLNKIEISCTNENASVSRKEALYITYSAAKPVSPNTYFIGIGINNYSARSSFVDLSYCVKDIRDLSAAFKQKFAGRLIIDTLMNDNASKENILALKEKLMHTSIDDKVIVSFSGHGMVDPLHPDDFYFVTGNMDVNNPATSGVSYAQLEELLDSIPARKKLLLLDACHSGESAGTGNNASNKIPGTKKGNDDNDKNKAGSIEILDVVENNDPSQTSATDIFKLMKEAFVDIRRNNGAYVLSAAQSNESAGEGGGITNGWFTSCLIEQLKQNASMNINELSQKVNQCVSAKSGGNQNTDNRQELAEFNWLLW